MSIAKKILIVQPLPGVGDMIWHVPHLRALRRIEGENADITLLAKTRSRADALLAGDPVVNHVLWLDQKGQPDLSRGNVPRMAKYLRPFAFDKIYVLHHSPRYLAAAWLAGIPVRSGYGFGTQRFFINDGVSLVAGLRYHHPIHKATAFVGLLGQRINEQDGLLRPLPAMMDVVDARMANIEKPWIGLGIGSSEAYKQYGAERLGELACSLADRGWRSFVLLGGPSEQSIADYIVQKLAAYNGVQTVSVADWPLTEVIAVQAKCAAYIGNDTGFLNISAALGVKSYGLFGATEPLFHSSCIHPIVPADGYCRDHGMSRIAPVDAASVVEAIAA